jgi:hypothetical protein
MGSTSDSGLKSSVLLGIASGILSQIGTAAVIERTPTENLPRWLRSPWAKRVAGVFAAGEIVANATISSLPARSKEGLPGRLIMGAASAGLEAVTTGRPTKLPALVGAAAAAGSAIAATPLRAALGKRIPDQLVALGETIVAGTLAAIAMRNRPNAG